MAVAVTGVDLEVRRGEVTGLVGRNGAGKTTLLRMLAGALLPTEGRVWRAAGLRAGLAMDRDVALYSDMPVGAYLSCMARLGPSGAGGPEPDEAADWLGLADRRRQEIRTLSRGYRQRVLLAQALLGAPDLILLDEPLNSLDPVQIAEVSALLRSLPWGPPWSSPPTWSPTCSTWWTTSPSCRRAPWWPAARWPGSSAPTATGRSRR